MSFATPADIQNARNEALEAFKRTAERDHTISTSVVLIAIYTALMDNAAQLADQNEKLERIASAVEKRNFSQSVIG